MKRAYLVASLLFTTVASGVSLPAIARAEGPLDVLELRDGSFLRGTVVERIAGQHVVFQLLTGERRTFPIADVLYAGPAENRPDAPPPATVMAPVLIPPPPVDDRATLTVQAVEHPSTTPMRYTLQQVTGTATSTVWTGRGVGFMQLDSFAPLCTAPCRYAIPRGTYNFGLSRNDGNAIRATGGPFTVDRDLFARVDYIDRSGFRVAGWLTFGLSLATGLLLMAIPVGIALHDPYAPQFSTGLLLAGAGVSVVGLAVSLPLVAQRDHARVDLSPTPFGN